MPKTTVTLEDVESKDVKVRGEDATVFEFKTSDGRKYTTFKRDVAVPGSRLRGSLVEITYEEKQKGEYTNYYLNGIEAVAGDPGPAVDLRGDLLGATGFTTTPQSSDKKDVSIARAVALKAAVETATGLQLVDADSSTILAIADVYAEWLLNGTAETEKPVADEKFPF